MGMILPCGSGSFGCSCFLSARYVAHPGFILRCIHGVTSVERDTAFIALQALLRVITTSHACTASSDPSEPPTSWATSTGGVLPDPHAHRQRPSGGAIPQVLSDYESRTCTEAKIDPDSLATPSFNQVNGGVFVLQFDVTRSEC
ncbi:hypothetical protein C8F04DRAFT_1258141 [Mycena alexandri]|uniref:Uncharacterized protein n=1 Tax=Mycena alexandri TaxID=1745969 RepID=A0AAD6X299_9AGAR|nr:hypothetical protein C8F04DRAFT_1258141 [Mycena alexandri]